LLQEAAFGMANVYADQHLTEMPSVLDVSVKAQSHTYAYTVRHVRIKDAIIFLLLTLPNVDRFSKFFHQQT